MKDWDDLIIKAYRINSWTAKFPTPSFSFLKKDMQIGNWMEFKAVQINSPVLVVR